MWTSTHVQLFWGPGNQIYTNFGDHVHTQKCQTIVDIPPNDAPGIQAHIYGISVNGVIQDGSDLGFYTRQGP